MTKKKKTKHFQLGSSVPPTQSLLAMVFFKREDHSLQAFEKKEIRLLAKHMIRWENIGVCRIFKICFWYNTVSLYIEEISGKKKLLFYNMFCMQFVLLLYVILCWKIQKWGEKRWDLFRFYTFCYYVFVLFL